MRVTNYQNHQHHITEMLRRQERLEDTRDRVTTGRRIDAPSDAPAEIAELLRTQSRAAELSRRNDAAEAALIPMKAGEATLGDITSALRQAKTLALQARNAATGDDQRQVLATQIEQIAKRVHELANEQVGDRYLFAGTANDSVPFTSGATVTYNGNARPILLSLTDGAPFTTNISGSELQDTRDGTDLFQNLQSLATAVRAGDDAGMATGMGRLDADVDNVIRLRGDMGARIQYVTMVQDRTKDDLLATQERQSHLEDADIAEAIIDYQSAEYAHEAGLAVLSRLNQPSLLDFLR